MSNLKDLKVTVSNLEVIEAALINSNLPGLVLRRSSVMCFANNMKKFCVVFEPSGALIDVAKNGEVLLVKSLLQKFLPSGLKLCDTFTTFDDEETLVVACYTSTCDVDELENLIKRL